ncbi:gp16 family protein [Neisseria perflava]|uniref:gp16 family protein n=1 Tax=Neisseria perflava TaxID=33053 RepID=UPI0020A18D27|nr:phage protein GemA/Gp16 family protein [Neisseria perflava]MCP1659318.1 phage gp16-like protein [Neisseria perflava]
MSYAYAGNPASRRALIAKIKIAQKELAMDDDTYRAVLLRVTGKDSCAKMGEGELEAVCAQMVRLGFRVKPKRKADVGQSPQRRASADPMMRKVEALLLDSGWHWNYAHGTARRMFGVDRVEWLSDGHMHKLVAALQIAANRKKAAEAK